MFAKCGHTYFRQGFFKVTNLECDSLDALMYHQTNHKSLAFIKVGKKFNSVLPKSRQLLGF